jgi:oligoribonuclease
MLYDKLIWIDLETTGLDQDDGMRGCIDHDILEIGLHITDLDFNILDEGLQIPIYHIMDDIKSKMNAFVLDMHTKNGLLEDVSRAVCNLSAADLVVTNYLASFDIVPGTVPICGNNVGFDKNFIAAQMPLLTKMLHYRKIDVSSFKEVARNIVPEAFFLAERLKEKDASHRALDDIKMSIKEMVIYRDHMLNYRKL